MGESVAGQFDEVRRRQRCETCRWFGGDEGDGTGACFRYPPRPAPADTLMVLDAEPTQPFGRSGLQRAKFGKYVCDAGAQVVYAVPHDEDAKLAEYHLPWVPAGHYCGEWAARQPDDWEPGEPGE